MRICTVDGCAKPHKARGLCSSHYNRMHYAANAEAMRERARRWHAENPDKAAERNRRRDPEHLRQYARRYYKAHRYDGLAHSANQRARALGVPGLLTGAAILARFHFHGFRCWRCGSLEEITVDHVKPMGAGGWNIPANVRPACASCNFGHTWEGRR